MPIARPVVALAILAASCTTPQSAEPAAKDVSAAPSYPPTRTVEQIDDYHGTKVPDPYRWLENDVRVDADVAAWVAAQNRVTDVFLGSIPERPAIRARVEKLFDFPRYSVPSKLGSRYVFSKNDGLQNQSVVYV